MKNEFSFYSVSQYLTAQRDRWIFDFDGPVAQFADRSSCGMMRDHLKVNEAAEVEYKGDTPREMSEKSSFIHSERDLDLPIGFGRGGVSVATTKKTQTFFSWKHQCILLGIVVCVFHLKAARELSAQYKAFFSPPNGKY